jgi:polyhydroxyalkanoate synthase
MMQLHRKAAPGGMGLAAAGKEPQLASGGSLWDAAASFLGAAMDAPRAAPILDPLQAAFAAGQELYKAGLLGTINTRRFARGLVPLGWPAVATTPRELSWAEGAARLWRYRPLDDARAPRPPILLVCSLINRPYVLDLIDERSVVRRLLEGGLDVWLLDWGTPLPEDAARGLADYALGLLPRAAERVRRESRAARIHLLGYCMGGTLALAAAAAGAIAPAGLIALATPVDLHDSGQLSRWCRTPGFDAAGLARLHGNVPPYLLQPAFKMLDPVGLATKLYHLEPKIDDDAFLRFFLAMETWLEDSVAFPGRAFAEWVAAYAENRLVRGTLRLDGTAIDLARVSCPLLTVVAEGDYICPPQSSLALRALAGTDDHQLMLQPGGHIGLSTGKSAHRELWPRAAAWVRAGAAPARRVMRSHKRMGARA